MTESFSLNGEASQSKNGMSSIGVKRISKIFENQIQEGINPGAQLVVMRNGQMILEQYEGYADTKKKQLVSPETRFLAFSISKSFISACVFKLVEDEMVNLDGSVADYWPEFGSQGKETITVRQVLLHQAGLPRRGLFDQIYNLSNWDKLTDNLANQKLEYTPGSKTAYHALNFGFILGEVIRRVSGMPVDEYLQKEFLLPLRMVNTSLKTTDYGSNSYARLYSGTLGHQFVAWLFNSPNVRAAVIPAASLHSTAREIAIFFQMLLNEGQYDGIRFLQPETVRLATSLGFEGFDEALRRTTRWGYGFYLGGDHTLNPDLPDGMGKGSTIDTFGHYGQRTSMAYADKSTGLVVVFLCNQFLSNHDYKNRLREISDAVWDAIED
jgi:CubicO group peptidase (beta-lactamase class C family)